ncbi:MAG: hypothetical protein AB1716_13475 [Planctomycetota bacterium]
MPSSQINRRTDQPDERPSNEVWLLDHAGDTALSCQCVEAAHDRMRLLVPVGYGLAVGQEYELRETLRVADAEPHGGKGRVRIAGLRRTSGERLDVEAVRITAAARRG